MFGSIMDSIYFDILSYTAWINLLVVSVGLLTNTLGLLIFTKKKLNKSSNMGSMHAILCIFNLPPLVNSLILEQLFPMLGIDLLSYSAWTCKLVSFWLRFSLDLSPVQQQIITFMIYLCVKDPVKYLRCYKKLKTVFLVVFLALFSVNLPFLFKEIKLEGEQLKCTGPDYLILLSDISNLLIRYLIPLVFMIMMNLIIIYQYFESKKVFCTIKSRSPKSFLLSVVIFNCMFIVLNLPLAVLELSSYFKFLLASKTGQDVFSRLNNVLLLALSLSYLCYSFTFFVHLSFNKLFKRQFILRIKGYLRLNFF